MSSEETKAQDENKPKPSSAKKTRWKAGAILAAVFVLGAGSGAAAMRSHMIRGWQRTMTDAPSEARARFRLEAMTRRLDLSDEQRAELETIISAAEQERARLTEDCRPQLEALRKRVEEQVDAVLTAEQRDKHREMLERRRHRHDSRRGPPHRKHRGKRGHPPDGPPPDGPPPDGPPPPPPDGPDAPPPPPPE